MQELQNLKNELLKDQKLTEESQVLIKKRKNR